MSDAPTDTAAHTYGGQRPAAAQGARRIALGIEYDGGAYAGWQSQAAQPSIQSLIERALTRVAAAPIAVVCAGRTDAGVHARAQVAHFDTVAARPRSAWLLGTNSYLPPDISVRWVRAVPNHFHARYSTLARTYRYLILNRAARSGLAAGRALCVHQPLDVAAMQAAAAPLLGEHDFSAFRSAECQSRSPVRILQRLSVERHADWITIELTANAFLHHMARNLVGLLLWIGRRQGAAQAAAQLLERRERDARVVTAAAEGLYLWRVDYPAQFRLPDDSAMITEPLAGWPPPAPQP